MKIEIFNTYTEVGGKAKKIIINALKENKNMLLCAASGNSPTETYLQLSEEYKKQPAIFDELRIIKLDEWGGISPDHPTTCESYLRKNLIEPLHIAESRYTSFISNPKDAMHECKRMKDRLAQEGPIDLCILGLGENGHIAFNEPGNYLEPDCHVARLSPTSLQHAMTLFSDEKPTYGLTLGMTDILNSKSILLLVNGFQKKQVFKQFLTKRITSNLPASFLWLHANVTCLTVEELIGDPDQ